MTRHARHTLRLMFILTISLALIVGIPGASARPAPSANTVCIIPISPMGTFCAQGILTSGPVCEGTQASYRCTLQSSMAIDVNGPQMCGTMRTEALPGTSLEICTDLFPAHAGFGPALGPTFTSCTSLSPTSPCIDPASGTTLHVTSEICASSQISDLGACEAWTTKIWLPPEGKANGNLGAILDLAEGVVAYAIELTEPEPLPVSIHEEEP